MKLVFATNNNHKLKEVKEILDNQFEILSLNDINCFEEIPETQNTIAGNASEKVHFIFNKYKIPIIITGLKSDYQKSLSLEVYNDKVYNFVGKLDFWEFVFVVKNGSNILSFTSSLIPEPLSFISIFTP